ncbi:hypothetical protein KNE206_56960 [Kitasatospora sp. NE20-6]|uniref:WXG100-like domain-containing protein n=1 Tax=Kitasatospora sp. NE20-6 TaxID=2859066 RepID=UPI0034DB8263
MSHTSIEVTGDMAGFFSKVTGTDWPQAREGLLRDVRDDYEALARDLPVLRGYIVELVALCRTQFEGEAADAFVDRMRSFIGVGGGDDCVSLATETARQLALCAGDVANSVEYTKWMAIAQLVQLLAEVALSVLWAPFTFGTSLLNLSWHYALVRQVLIALLKYLLRTIALHTFAGVAGGLALDGLTQAIQFAHHDRHTWDTAATAQAAGSGAIGGLLAGPLDLLGTGLGKLVGSAIGRSAGSVAGHRLAEGLLAAADSAAEEAVAAGARAPAAAASRGLARDLGRLMDATSPWLAQGSSGFAKSSVADGFTSATAKAFERNLAGVLGTHAARTLGGEFGEAFTRHWGQAGADHGVLSGILRDVLSKAAPSPGGLDALARLVPGLADHMPHGNLPFHLGFALGEQLEGGLHNALTEGFSTMAFSEDHHFSVSGTSFVSGLATSLLSRALHHAASPFLTRYATWVQNLQHAPVEPGHNAYFGPLHPLTVLSVLSNISGNPAPFPVPRLGLRPDDHPGQPHTVSAPVTPARALAELHQPEPAIPHPVRTQEPYGVPSPHDTASSPAAQPRTASTAPTEDPAFTAPGRSDDPQVRHPPARVTDLKRIGASDLLVGLHTDDTAVVRDLTRLFHDALPGDLPAARSIVQSFFDPATLRPKLSALSRGDIWEAPFDLGAWSGRVSVRADVEDLTFASVAEKVEFDNGSEREALVGHQDDTARRLTTGVQGRLKAGRFDLTEAVSYQHDQVQGSLRSDAGRTIARGKTVEPGALFTGRLRLTLDFADLTLHGKAFTLPDGSRTKHLDIGATMGFPLRDTLDPQGSRPPVGPRFAPPQRIVDGLRLGGSDIVLDVSAARRTPSGTVPPMVEVLTGVEATGSEVLGDLWPQLRERLHTELDLGRLQQDLKSMMAGEYTRVEVFSGDGLARGSVEITATVRAMWQTGTTAQTEFNVGTGVHRTDSRQDTAGHGVQFPLPGLLGGSANAASSGAAGGGVQLIRDRVRIAGTAHELTLTTKTKAPGVVYDGRSALQLVFTRTGPLGTERGTATAEVEFRALVEQSEARPVGDTPYGEQSGQAGSRPSDDPTLFVATDRPQPATRRTWEPGTEIHSPPDRVWTTGPGGGLPDTTTLRDLADVALVHQRLENEGRRVLGTAWDGVKDQLHHVFSHSVLASRITAMTRGLPLETPELATRGPLMHRIKITGTARVVDMEYKRYEPKAELHTVDEIVTFTADRHLLSTARTGQIQGNGSATPATQTGIDIGGSSGHQVRDRGGWRDGTSGKVYANGKYARPQALFTSTVELDLRLTTDGTEHRLRVPVSAEFSIDAKDTGRYRVGADGLGVFDGPGTGRPQHHQPPAQPHDPPTRITTRGAMSASDVVHSLGTGDAAVHEAVRAALRRHFGAVPDDVLMRLGERLDPFALKAQLSALSRGGEIREDISVHGWTGTVEVRATLRNFRHTDTMDTFEFEHGSQLRTAAGFGKDERIRTTFSLPFKIKLPHLDLGVTVTHRIDRVKGLAVDTSGGTVSKGKTVEPAGLFTGTARFTVHLELSGPGRAVHQADLVVPVEATIAVPLRDAPKHDTAPHRTRLAGPPEQPPPAAPTRIERTRRLGSSDIVTDVHPLTHGHTAADDTPMSATLRAADAVGRRTLGPDWAGIRQKLLAELDLTRLQPQLKPMMAGHEIVVRHGRSTVRVSASVARLHYVGDTGQTEFNTGTRTQRSFATSDGVSTYGKGHGSSITVSVAGTSDVLPTGVSLTAGGSVTHSRGHDLMEVQAGRTTAGTATKAKTPGAAYTGEATLILRMERRPLLTLGDRHRAVPGPRTDRVTHQATTDRIRALGDTAWRSFLHTGTVTRAIATAGIGFDATVEASETGPGTTTHPQPAAPHLGPVNGSPPPAPPHDAIVRMPPARVWNEGLRDVDVLRWLGDSSGIQDLLRRHGPDFFGRRTWTRLESVARSTTSHSQLASRFTSATRGEDLATPDPGRRLLVANCSIETSLRIVQLEYDRTDGKVELSPTNETSVSSARTRLDWSLWGGQAQLGLKAGLDGQTEATLQASAGGQHRVRQGTVHGNAGRVVSNAKLATPMARFNGFAEVTLTFVKGEQRLVESGIIPVTVDIPERETGQAGVPAGHYLAFGPDDPLGRPIALDRSKPNQTPETGDEPEAGPARPLPAGPRSDHIERELAGHQAPARPTHASEQSPEDELAALVAEVLTAASPSHTP